MKDNWRTCLKFGPLIFVPYRKKYVETYHEWMKDPYLQEVTASEPLSLEEEYEMQESWLNDPYKCTFLIKLVCTSEDSETDSELIGDINLFMHDRDDRSIAEIEVMIAIPAYWRLGYGNLALCMIMRYGVEFLNITKFFAKISETNTGSIKLFERLGYVQVNYCAAFKEIEYELRCHSDSTPTINNIDAAELSTNVVASGDIAPAGAAKDSSEGNTNTNASTNTNTTVSSGCDASYVKGHREYSETLKNILLVTHGWVHENDFTVDSEEIE